MELISSFLFFRKYFCYMFGSVPGESGYEFQINKNCFRIWVNHVHNYWDEKKDVSYIKKCKKYKCKARNFI